MEDEKSVKVSKKTLGTEARELDETAFADSAAPTSGAAQREKLAALESMSVEERRANLASAMGAPQRGRRPKPAPYDPRPRRILYARGIALGLLTLLVVVVIILILTTLQPMQLG